MESENVIQVVEDYNYVAKTVDKAYGSYSDITPANIIAILELAYSIGVMEENHRHDIADDCLESCTKHISCIDTRERRS